MISKFLKNMNLFKILIGCPQPPQRDHVSWFYVNIKSDDITIDITTSNKIRYKCDKGYHFSVNESIVSECFNGNWDINVAPLCLPGYLKVFWKKND